MTTEIQPYSSFQAINVGPNLPTGLRLTGGKTRPFVYSLGVNSTVPYIRLIGGSTSQKLFSWGEQIIVPPGEMVTVENASYHPGDVYLQSGADPAAIPARVTVPVGLVNVNGAATGSFGVDTRRAKRAFVSGFAETTANEAIGITGYARERQHDVTIGFSYFATPIAYYLYFTYIPIGTFLGLMPLGNKALPGDPVHALLDYAEFAYTGIDTRSESGAVYYVLEYT